MNLAAFQQELVDDLYEILVTDDENKGITIYGDVGSGNISPSYRPLLVI